MTAGSAGTTGSGGAGGVTAGAGMGGSFGGGTAGGTGGAGGSGATGGSIVIPPDDGGLPPLTTEPMTICIDFSAVDGGTSTGAGGEGGEAGAPTLASCPSPDQVPELQGMPCTLVSSHTGTGWDLVEVTAGPRLEGTACCYDLLVHKTECVYVGRAFLVDEGLVKAVVRDGGGWHFGASPDVASLSDATRRALEEAWLKDALFEHASVATFARFAVQLLGVGAPSRLLHATLSAGKDEIRHAELCFSLASAYAGRALEPDAFPLDDRLPIQRDLADIVSETIVEGCIGETLAALQAEAQLAVTTDPVVRESLIATVDDETRHAELAWQVVAWALAEGGERIRRVAERAFSSFDPPRAPNIDLRGVDRAAFRAHGRLEPDEARRVALEALTAVVRPCAAALLGRDVMPHLAAAA